MAGSPGKVSPPHTKEFREGYQKRVGDAEFRSQELFEDGLQVPGERSAVDGRRVPGQLAGRTKRVYFPEREEDVPVIHNMGVRCSRWIVVWKNCACNVYAGSDGDKNTTYLKCNVKGATVEVWLIPENDDVRRKSRQ